MLVAAGSGLTVFMTSAWQLLLLLGRAGRHRHRLDVDGVRRHRVSTRWFVARRGLVSGILTAANATGQLIFLPVIAALTAHHGWRPAAVTVTVAALAVVPLVLLGMRDHPHDLGLLAYGATEADPGPPRARRGPATAPRWRCSALLGAARTPVFWLLAGSFAICGATTNGLIGTHFIPAAQDHGMPVTTAASLLALVGVFDVAGTIASGWLTDRYDPRVLLLGLLRRARAVAAGAAVAAVARHHARAPGCSSCSTAWTGWPPCRRRSRCAASTSPTRRPIVFGWVFAAHQLGAAVAAAGAGLHPRRPGLLRPGLLHRRGPVRARRAAVPHGPPVGGRAQRRSERRATTKPPNGMTESSRTIPVVRPSQRSLPRTSNSASST